MSDADKPNRQPIEQLYRNDSYFRLLIENINDNITVFDKNGITLFVSSAGARDLGGQPADFVGRHLSEYLPEQAETVLERHSRAIESGELTLFEDELDLPTGRKWYESGHHPVREADGEISGVLVISRDITERKQAEQALLASERRLQQSQKMEAIGRLAGGIAHDLNNLLTGIVGYGSLLQMNLGSDDPNTEKVEEILSICERARDLTMNLLGFARIGKFLKKRIGLNESIREVSKLLEHAVSKKIGIELRLTDNLSQIGGDAGQINQILLNLGINAADAMSATGGTLTIATRDTVIEPTRPKLPSDLEPGRYVEVSVTDTGVGMDAETREQAFEPFFTTKPQGEGTGLGLSMVYGAVKNHGGTVTVDSAPGRGTVVTILLPALEPDSDLATPPTGKRGAVAKGQGTILVVDDEEIVRASTAEMLEWMGYRVMQAANGEEAVKVYLEKQDEITLVLLDMAMPVMDGPETFRKLKEIDPEVRALLFSGYSADAAANELIDEGAVGFVQKPFLPETLAIEVAKAVATR